MVHVLTWGREVEGLRETGDEEFDEHRPVCVQLLGGTGGSGATNPRLPGNKSLKKINYMY